ncbi:MAG: hypothetical protein M1826_006224 [Phylliscum demangeonii]|nr:MAG: hypothetical protein M1826_006224 [Phylliscum demangeonii]
MVWVLCALSTLALFVTSVPAQSPWTDIHEEGRCAFRGQCGAKSFFGSELPCPDNGLAKAPDPNARRKLVDICGAKWSDSLVCCQEDQLDVLASNFKRVEPLISVCPACKINFYDLFCTFTCSPDQSVFVNVTKVQTSRAKKTVATELDYFVAAEYGSGFYDSCKDVKYSATNGYVMDFLGNGAKNYTSFLKFLGDEKPFLGSPFQLNFPPVSQIKKPMHPMDERPKKCNDTDERYRCSCVDCPSSCPPLPALVKDEQCHVGALPCVSFAAILTYCLLLSLFIGALVLHFAWLRHARRKSERVRLLQDSTLSDDEDEADVVHQAGEYIVPEKQYPLNTQLERLFSSLGRHAARYPGITIGVSIFVVGLLSLGWINFAVERSPVRLWVSPTSAAAQEKAFFDDHFGPFYRTEQVFLVNDTSAGTPGPVLSYDTLAWWFDVENRVRRLKSMEQGVTLDDVCFKPTGEACVVESITGYFPGGFSDLRPDTWEKGLSDCIEKPVECLPAFGQPLKKEMVLGGWEETGDVLQSNALIATWVISNHKEGTEEESSAMDWERSLKGLLMAVQTEARERALRISFSTEISLEQELNKSTNTDAKIVVISYLIMFLYASLALGSTTVALRSLLSHPRTALVRSKFTLGVFGILIVLMSVSASVGLFSAAGVKVTLIIAEVIPFLVLAVGVDNIFLLVHEFDRVSSSYPDSKIEDRAAKALGRMGPSILLSATTETVAFVLGVFVGMPAVRNFAAYAAGAVVINALLQVTMFISVLALNEKRMEEGRADCIPCVKFKSAGVVDVNGLFASPNTETESSLQRFIRKSYTPTLLRREVKAAVVVVFFGLLTAGIALIPDMKLGLDQRIAIPSDSYLIPYFNDLDAYFETGPPVYFVTRQLNISEHAHQQQVCGRFTTCDLYSLTNTLEQERKQSERSYIAEPAASWIDDFFFWLNPDNDQCCREGGKVCFEDRDPPWNITLHGMPEGADFFHYLSKWIRSPSNADCPLGGRAAYGNAVVIDNSNLTIPASHFRTSHRPLKNQSDFIEAYASARRVADSISAKHDIDVFPYSNFYIYFEQYRSIVRHTTGLLSSAMLLILVITSLFLGSLKTGLVVTGTVIMIVVDIMGAMVVAGVSLNAVSLVNLIISVGISVEFCAHIARAFSFPSHGVMERAGAKYRGKNARAWAAMVNVGGSVFTGITITKFLGVSVLAFTRSKIFEVYYFRIWLALVVLAAAHALVFLPVALSIFGGNGYVDSQGDGGLEEDLAARRQRALLPDEDSDSDDG